MGIGKIFRNGGSQAVRLPKDCQLPGTEVLVRKVGDVVMLVPKEKAWDIWEKSLGQFSDDFMLERDQGVQEEREFHFD